MSNGEKSSDEHIIDKVLSGESDAYRVIVDRYVERVYSLIYSIVRNREDSQELTSDVFMKAYGKLRKFRRESMFSTWLYSIAYNTAVSHIRQIKMAQVSVNESQLGALGDDREETLLKEAELQRLETALGKLIPADRALIDMFYVNKMTATQIASVVNDSEGSVKIKIFRIRRKLAVIIKYMKTREIMEMEPDHNDFLGERLSRITKPPVPADIANEILSKVRIAERKRNAWFNLKSIMLAVLMIGGGIAACYFLFSFGGIDTLSWAGVWEPLSKIAGQTGTQSNMIYLAGIGVGIFYLIINGIITVRKKNKKV